MVAPAATSKRLEARSSLVRNNTEYSGNRLSAYEHLPRPVRSRRNGTLGTTAAETCSSDVSSSLVSPTNVTHATPRPKSPRQPSALRSNYSAAQLAQQRVASRSISSSSPRSAKKRAMSAPSKKRAKTPTPQTILAAQHFQSAVVKAPQDFDALLPKRHLVSREPSWKTTDVTISGSSTASASTESTSVSSPPRIPTRRQTNRSVSPLSQRPSSRNSGRIKEPDSSLLRGCIQGGLIGGAFLGAKFSECFFLTGDLYQQECGPHQERGGDRMFLYRQRKGSGDDDDIVEDDTTFYSGSKFTEETERSRSRTNTTSPWSRSRSTSTAATSEYEPKTKTDPPATHLRSNRKSDSREPDEEKTPTRRTYPRHYDSFDVAHHTIRYDQGEMPRLHTTRGTSTTPWSEAVQEATSEFVELRNRRLEMFEQDAQRSSPHAQSTQDNAGPQSPPKLHKEVSSFIPEPAEIQRIGQLTDGESAGSPLYPPWRRQQLSLPPNDPNEQLRKELEETRRCLDQAREELQHAQEIAARQQADVNTRTSQLANEKVNVESKLMEEARAKEDLLKKIAELQEETAQLKSTLQASQKEDMGSPCRRSPRSPSVDSPLSPRPSPPASPQRKMEQENSPVRNRGTTLIVTSPDRALADDMFDETSPTSSKDSEDTPESSKRTYDSGAVLNLVREVVRGGKIGTKTVSPVSVMDMETPNEQARDVVCTPPREESDKDTREPGSPYLSSRLISLRSELLEVRSQLAEKDAARIKAESQRDELQAMNREIQQETKKLREEVNELKQLVLHMQIKEDETETKYQKKVDQIMVELAKAKEQAQKEAKEKEKLEEELTGTQNEADELRGQVARFMTELDRTKKESEEKLRVTDAEAKGLQEELRRMKTKLSQTNAEIVQQAAEHLKRRQEIEAELEQSKETATALRRRVLFMDDQLTSAEAETDELRRQLSSSDDGRSANGISPSNTSWKKRMAGMAESISRSLTDNMVDGPIIIPDAPPKDARSSVMERLRNTLDPNQGKVN